MDDVLRKDILDAVKKSLPQQLGESLQEELEALAGLRAQAKVDAGMLERARAERDMAQAKSLELAAQLVAHNKITDREAAVLLREQQQALRDLEVRLLNQRHTELLNLMGLVFRSPVYQTNLQGSVPMLHPGSPVPNGGYPVPPSVVQSPINLNQTISTN